MTRNEKGAVRRLWGRRGLPCASASRLVHQGAFNQGEVNLSGQFETEEGRVLALAPEHAAVDELMGVRVEDADVGAGADRQVSTFGNAGDFGRFGRDAGEGVD